MVKIVNDILALVDSGSAVVLIGLDISAAFDTVSHLKLLARVETKFGIEGAELDWIDSYPSNCMFLVCVGASSSAGMPQGSVLGPILFTANVAPIGKLIESFGVKYHMYADDPQLYTAITTSPDSTVEHP